MLIHTIVVQDYNLLDLIKPIKYNNFVNPPTESKSSVYIMCRLIFFPNYLYWENAPIKLA